MSRKTAGVQHSMQGVFVFVLLGLFALMSTLMVLLGAQMYRATVARSTANNESRVLSAYVRSMVRAEDGDRALSVERPDGETVALAMREDIEGRQYVTWLYCHEGSLYELFTEAAYSFDPEAGTPICPAADFDPAIDNGLLTVRMLDGAGKAREVRVALHGDPAEPGEGLEEADGDDAGLVEF